MRICIVDTSTRPKTLSSVNVHEHNCRMLRRHFMNEGHAVTLYYSDDDVDPRKQYDVILFSYGSFYLDFKKFERLFDSQRNAKIGWITNEYNLAPNSFVYKRISFVINNFESQKEDKMPTLTVNLNSLIARSPNPLSDKRFDLCYYGTYRKDREIYFNKYLHDPLILSTSSKNLKRFQAAGATSKYIEKMSWVKEQETLNHFSFSLYIEDFYTHSHFNFLANRFYESLFCNVVPLFDKSCLNTIRKSGYDIPDDFIVESCEDVKAVLARRNIADFKADFLSKMTEKALQEKEDTLRNVTSFIESIASGAADAFH